MASELETAYVARVATLNQAAFAASQNKKAFRAFSKIIKEMFGKQELTPKGRLQERLDEERALELEMSKRKR